MGCVNVGKEELLLLVWAYKENHKKQRKNRSCQRAVVINAIFERISYLLQEADFDREACSENALFVWANLCSRQWKNRRKTGVGALRDSTIHSMLVQRVIDMQMEGTEL